jgi:hypothetical protein
LITVPLPPPELSQPAFEPHLAIDPDEPRRIVVAAQYGISRNRGGRNLWTWNSEDGGRSWTGAQMPLPSATASLAADAVTGIAVDGSALLTFLFADSATFRGGAAFTRSAPENLLFGPASVVVRDRLTEGGGAIDKGWLAVDRGATSPLRGTTYLSWHANRPLPNRTVESIIWLASSRDGGKSWNEPVRVSEHTGAQIAVRTDGVVDLVFTDRDGRALLHTSSDDGGRSFAEHDTITTASTAELIDLPSLATTPDDGVVVCWAQGPTDASTDYRIRCARGPAGWTIADLEPSRAGASGFPAVAANASGIWVASYRADSAALAVRLHRSTDGGRTFTLHATLATRPFGIDRFCPAPSAPCRRTLEETGAYFPGDYIGIAAGRDRVAVAYALPDRDDPDDARPAARSSIFIALVRW